MCVRFLCYFQLTVYVVETGNRSQCFTNSRNINVI